MQSSMKPLRAIMDKIRHYSIDENEFCLIKKPLTTIEDI